MVYTMGYSLDCSMGLAWFIVSVIAWTLTWVIAWVKAWTIVSVIA